jgi:putative secretion ATPase (PEP-CTERM system associated)
MYETYYHLNARPFQLSPDPRFFYSSSGHRKALAYLVYGASQREGFIVITGEVGAGKTMLARMLALKLEQQNLVLAQIVSTQLGADDMLRMVGAAFGLPEEKSKAGLLRDIERLLTAMHKQGRRALLLVDEAQNLPIGAIEELRMLSNFQYGEKSLLQTFLLGQPEFRRTLQSPGMEQLRQRVLASCHLGPIDASETQPYIMHRLRIAGWNGDPALSDDVYATIHRHTGGIPRKINLLCDRLLLLGRLDDKHRIGADDVAEVVEDLGHEYAPLTLHTGGR